MDGAVGGADIGVDVQGFLKDRTFSVHLDLHQLDRSIHDLQQQFTALLRDAVRIPNDQALLKSVRNNRNE